MNVQFCWHLHIYYTFLQPILTSLATNAIFFLISSRFNYSVFIGFLLLGLGSTFDNIFQAFCLSPIQKSPNIHLSPDWSMGLWYQNRFSSYLCWNHQFRLYYNANNSHPAVSRDLVCISFLPSLSFYLSCLKSGANVRQNCSNVSSPCWNYTTAVTLSQVKTNWSSPIVWSLSSFTYCQF